MPPKRESPLEIPISIPYCYVWMTEGCHDRSRLFKKYVSKWIKRSHPELHMKHIKGMKAICERRGDT